MFGSWKRRGSQESTSEAADWMETEDILSEIEEELSSFLIRKQGWPGVHVAALEELPSWMKPASLHPLSSSSGTGTGQKAASMKERKMNNTHQPDQVSIA